ncbi:MAG: HDOD domain-containing protein, partial [Desulfonatronovibrio sp.]
RSRAVMGLSRNNVRNLVNKYHGPKAKASLKPQLPRDFSRPDIRAVVRKQAGLVSLPDVFYRIVEVIKNPTSSAADIADVISKDASISSRLLRLVNSPFYGFMSRIDTLTRAVAVVGTIEISNLTMGISVTSSFKNIPFDFLDMNDFWEHSIAVGVVARILATLNGAPSLEKVFVGGLLHDIGRLTLFCNYPELSRNMLTWHVARPISLNMLEQKIFGFSHAGLGGRLLKEWKVPEGLCNMVDNHHAFHKSTDSLDVLFVKAADVIAHTLGYGHSGTRRVPPLTDQEWDKTGLSVNILPDVASQAQNQIQDLKNIIIKEHNHAA